MEHSGASLAVDVTAERPFAARPQRVSLARPRAAMCRPLVGLAGVMFIGVVVPVIVAAITGNLAIPHSDAWAMSRITQVFAETGQIHLVNWNDMNLIGQVVMLGPLGSLIVVQQLSVAVLGLICLWCTYDLVAFTCGRNAGVFAALLMALWPGFPSLATAFMTDIPALAGTLLALVIGRRAFARDSRALFTIALLVGFWAVSVREQAVAAPLALLGYGWFTRRSRDRLGAATIIGTAVAFGLITIGFEVWRSALPAAQNPHPSLQLGTMLRLAWTTPPQAFATLALPLAPALIWTARPRAWSRRAQIVAGVVFVLLLVRTCTGDLFVGDYLTDGGEYHGVVPGGDFVIPLQLWHVVTVLGVISGALLAGTLVERWRMSEPILGIFTVLTAAETLVFSIAGNGIFDRYLLALLPGAAAIVLAKSRACDPAPTRPPHEDSSRLDARRLIAIASVGVIAIATAILTLNADSYDMARWRLGERLTASGIPAARIDAGLEWVGWHSPRGVRVPNMGATHAANLLWVQHMFSTELPCVLVTNLPIGRATLARSHLRSMGTFAYRTDLIGRDQSLLYAYRFPVQGCRDEARR